MRYAEHPELLVTMRQYGKVCLYGISLALQVQTWFKAHYENSDDGTTIGDGTGMTVFKCA